MNEPLPTGTVTLLLADVEGSTQLWHSRPDEMTAAIANLDRTLAELVSTHHGVRPIEQGEGDSFVIAFSRASDAVACALALQRAPLAPLRLRVGVHTGEVQFRDETTTGTTMSGRPSTGPRDSASSRMAARRSCRAPPAIWSPTRSPTTHGWPSWARMYCGICPVRSASRSCAIPTCATSSLPCGNVEPPKSLSPNIFRFSSPASWDATRKWSRCATCSRRTGW